MAGMIQGRDGKWYQKLYDDEPSDGVVYSATEEEKASQRRAWEALQAARAEQEHKRLNTLTEELVAIICQSPALLEKLANALANRGCEACDYQLLSPNCWPGEPLMPGAPLDERGCVIMNGEPVDMTTDTDGGKVERIHRDGETFLPPPPAPRPSWRDREPML